MNIMELVAKYNLQINTLEQYIKDTGFPHSTGILGIDINEDLFLTKLEDYKDYSIYQNYLNTPKSERAGLLDNMSENGKMKYLDDEDLAFLTNEEKYIRDAKDNEQRKKSDIANILISSGFNFDGYRIVKYSGYISGDDCITIPRDDFFSSNKVEDHLCDALVKIRRQALKELKEAAYELGCNAVIGVDFDYITMDPHHTSALRRDITVYEDYVICVTANGNAVVIEKDETR
ncbi:Uncharacterized conserved protein YbjQ, UPF0145 family [Oribacterium sp. KHPX15]|uniref:heavy metal-binding domain-containing protein n=1 Tax=Oribacterium sp. KHPX15 TaxID=1855342 RepID=UPI0008971C05|nr:heavy metal-binding domain-containing protein [Oribacterium sp. KHPX15]SEA49826.1 Uncharacterized conserved protein YbjQ, UPF0145 family [Oribacterium sp. KHPX15]